MPAADLNALSSPPPNPFTVTALAAMTNDEGETASGTFTFETYYAKQEKTSSTPSGPAPTPVHETRPGPVGVLLSHRISESFNNAGTNPRFTDVTFDKPAYLDVPPSGDITEPAEGVASRFWVRTKTSAQLRALPEPPSNPFTVKATATMTNDEGHTGTVTFTTKYQTEEPPTPTAKTGTGVFNAPAGALTSISADQVFDNAGTNPTFTNVDFYSTYYYSGTGISDSGQVWVRVKTDAELNALDVVPRNPFTSSASVTMTNDEGQTATGTASFKTTYVKPSSPSGGPTPKQMGVLNLRPGYDYIYRPHLLFDNVGTNAKITGAAFTTLDYYDKSNTGVWGGEVYVFAKTAAQLNALASPPPSTFTVDVMVTMTNDAGQTATNTLTFRTTYDPT